MSTIQPVATLLLLVVGGCCSLSAIQLPYSITLECSASTGTRIAVWIERPDGEKIALFDREADVVSDAPWTIVLSTADVQCVGAGLTLRAAASSQSSSPEAVLSITAQRKDSLEAAWVVRAVIGPGDDRFWTRVLGCSR